MTYVVLARKYRPQTFDDVVGQEAVARTLKNAIRADRVAHAFLFSGPRGIGKTSLARILAKALNCEKGVTPEPCGSCVSCRAVAEGRDLDVIEIDGASNNGVENVRELRQHSDYVALRSRFKIYIIDEVHMLSKGAFNALLKTLEEPPAHVKFIFATTEPEKVPDTILSRCQRYQLREIGPADIARRLGQICRAEGIEADDGVLELIARHAGGGMRDAQSALDQLRSYCTGLLTPAAAAQVLGIAAHEALFELTSAVARSDAAAALAAVGRTMAGARAAAEVVEQWIDFLREVLIAATCGTAAAEIMRPGTATAAETAELAAAMSPEFLVYAVSVLSQTRSRMTRSMAHEVLLEIAVIKLCRTDAFRPLSEIVELAASVKSSAATARGSRTRGGRETGGTAAAPAAPAADDPGDLEGPPLLQDSAADADFWRRLHDEVEASAGPRLASYLREAGLVRVGEGEVVARLDAAFHRKELENRENRARIESCIEKVLGNKRVFKVVEGRRAGSGNEKPETRRKKAPEPAGAGDAGKDADLDKGVREAMRLFNGTVTSVKAIRQDEPAGPPEGEVSPA